MNSETVLYNATLILPDRTMRGVIVIKKGIITRIDEDTGFHVKGVDCMGDYLLPGLIEIHTDNLEKHIVPRPGIYWPSSHASVIAHDNQIFNSGITTVLDAVALGFSDSKEARSKILDRSIMAVKYAGKNGWLRADHFLHMRCELPSATLLESCKTYIEDPLVKLVSVMDHTPGQRQWRDLSKWRTFHSDKKWTDEDAQAVINSRKRLRDAYAVKNRRAIVGMCRSRDLPIASHDDTTEAHCVEAWEEGICISEFPTTFQAAKKAKELGMSIIMGAPNMVRGKSHSGNISARLLIENNLLDGFSSDYMPISLLHAAFEMNRRTRCPMFSALSTVTANIAKMVRLDDRGSLEQGKKADIILVKQENNYPIISSIWKDGLRMLACRN